MRTRSLSRAALALVLAAALALPACDFDLSNPNAAEEDVAFGTRDGLLTSAVGLQRLYNVDAYAQLVQVPAVTARELAVDRTFENLVNLEAGGAALTNTNASIAALHNVLYRVATFAANLRRGAETAQGVEPELRSGLVALANFYRAAALGALAQNFTHVAVEPGTPTVPATFVPREVAFARAAELLAEAEQTLTATPPNTAFRAILPTGFDLLNTVRAYRARFELFAGNLQAALDAANRVPPGTTSTFGYTELASNPLYTSFYVGTPSYGARQNLGLPAVQDGDRRIAFYTNPAQVRTSTPNGHPIVPLLGFFAQSRSQPIPAFLPGELELIRAEVALRQQRLGDAVTHLNAVRTKTPEQDPFGVGAGLPPYAGPVTEAALREELFYQRAVELYLQGLRLHDARRLGRPGPSSNPFERNRDFYPFPQQERINNPNTPQDPNV